MQFVKYIKKNYRVITLGSYLLPILLSVIVSLSHVVTFWEIANPAGWSIFLSIAIEVAVLSSIAASRISNWAWFPFSVVTFVQIIGNIFYSYTNINLTDPLFKSWVELSDPLFNFIGFGTDGNLVVHKRIVATFLGGTIPLISILFFHFFIRETRMNPVDLSSESAPEQTETVLGEPNSAKTPNLDPVLAEYDTLSTANITPEIKEVIEVLPVDNTFDEPSSADKLIANMANIPVEVLQQPYKKPIDDFIDINDLSTVYPEMVELNVPNIESETFDSNVSVDSGDEKKK